MSARATKGQREAPATLEVDAELVRDLAELIEDDQAKLVLNLVLDLHPADLAQLLQHLSLDQADRLLSWLSVEQSARALAEVGPPRRGALLGRRSAGWVIERLNELETDDAVDILGELPDELADEVLPRLDDAPDLRRLLSFSADSAGGIMGTELVTVLPEQTVAHATAEVRRNAEWLEEYFAVFVCERSRRLKGVVSQKKLLLSPPEVRVSSIMEEEVISVRVDTDQEEVSRIMERYDLVVLPVLDRLGRLVGRITIDDVVDVMREEAAEDIQRMSGLTIGESPADSVLRVSRGRLPWLLAGMAGAGVSGLLIGLFQGALERAVVLATFIPLVMAMAGNAGIQSSSIVVQGLASGAIWSTDVPRRLSKELLVALLNGVALGTVLGTAVLVLPIDAGDNLTLALTASLALLVVIVLATGIGTAIPLLLHRIGVDPAIATGTFITTSNDLVALAVFFSLARWVYL